MKVVRARQRSFSPDFLLINQSKMRMPRKFVSHWLVHLLPFLLKLKVRGHKILASELTVVFVEPRESRKLNFRYRKKDKATDVLSFHPGDDVSGMIFGELVICPQVIQKQAKEHGQTFRQEL